MFAYMYMTTEQQGLMTGTKKISDNDAYVNYLMSPQRMRMDMHMLMAMYGVTGRLSVMAMADYNVNTMQMKMLPGTMHMHGMDSNTVMPTDMQTRTQGIGDIKLYALYRARSGVASTWVVSLGLNIPTGNINNNGGGNVMYQGMRLPYAMQTGSGTFDLLPGVTYLKQAKKLSYSMQALATLRPFYNADGYRFGNDVTLNAWGSYRVVRCASVSLRLENVWSGTISGNDTRVLRVMEPSADTRNYGGDLASCYAGINVYFHKQNLNGKLSLEAGLPWYQSVNGIQLAVTHAVYAGTTVEF